MLKKPLRNKTREIVDYALYDEEDDWLVGSYTWCRGPKGYAQTGGGHSRLMRMHSMIMGKRPGLEIDHINRNKLDNRRENLRFVTRSQNNLNRHQGTGISYLARIDRYWAKATLHKKTYNLGYYKTYNEALAARAAWNKENQLPLVLKEWSEQTNEMAKA